MAVTYKHMTDNLHGADNCTKPNLNIPCFMLRRRAANAKRFQIYIIIVAVRINLTAPYLH